KKDCAARRCRTILDRNDCRVVLNDRDYRTNGEECERITDVDDWIGRPDGTVRNRIFDLYGSIQPESASVQDYIGLISGTRRADICEPNARSIERTAEASQNLVRNPLIVGKIGWAVV